MGDSIQPTDVPENIRVLSNGAWQDKSNGRIVRAAPGQAWDSKRASEAAKRRAEKVRQKTRKGIVAAVQNKTPEKAIHDFPDAHQEVVETLMTEVVLNNQERGKARIDTYGTLLTMEGSVGKIKQDGMVHEGMTITFSPEVAKHLVDGLMRWRQGRGAETVEVVEGTFNVGD